MQENEKGIKSVDKYTLLNTIIEVNSKGKVHKAKNNNQLYEMLVLPKDQFNGKVSLLEEMQGEIKKMKLLEHPNILRFVSLVETPNTYYICSEITSEGTLYDYILKKKTLSENMSFEIFVQILDGYKEFLRRGVLHANLSSKSIYKSKRTFKISSLFLRKNQRDFATPHKLCFLPPESLDNVEIDPGYDSWALGMIFCEMVFGGLPFIAENIEDLRKCHDAMDNALKVAAKKHELSNECFSFIKGFFHKKPKQRHYWNDIVQHEFFAMQKERIEIYLLENINDHIHEIKQKNIIEDLMDDKLNIFKKNVLESFERVRNDFGYYCFIYQRIVHSSSIFSKLQRKSSLEEEMGNIDLDEGVNTMKQTIPKSLSDLEKFMVRSASLSPSNSPKKKSKTDEINEGSPKKHLALLPLEFSIEEAKSLEIKNDEYPDQEDEPISAKLKVTLIDLQKINSQYKKSKMQKLSVILENSLEVSTAVTKEVNVFEEIMKEMIYYYMHEKEIVEFLMNVARELQQDGSDMALNSLLSFMIAKLGCIRMKFLMENTRKEVNIFKLIYWEQLLKSPVYANLIVIVEESKQHYLSMLSTNYKNAMLVKENEVFLRKESLDTDLIMGNKYEPFLNSIFCLMIDSFEIISKKSKAIELQNKTQSLKLTKLAFKLIYITKMIKTLGVNGWDASDCFDLSIFKEKLMNMSLREVESCSLKVKKEI